MLGRQLKTKTKKIYDTERFTSILQVKETLINQYLINWYDQNKRDLPWRNTSNAYHIWLSEVILQQTRVAQGLPYFRRFVQKFHTVHDLANAPEDEILRVWQGLGYYSRARNLHKCAKIVSNEYNGKFPDERQELAKLPGIGPYTSAAIASFAFSKKEAAIDGNVLRVLTRIYGIEDDISDKRTVDAIREIANIIIPSEDPGKFNQAIMEFGALNCVPKNPKCESCGLRDICEAKIQGKEILIPVKLKKIKRKSRYFNYLVVEIGNKYLMRKRGYDDIWKGLFEFCLIENDIVTTFAELALPNVLTMNSKCWELTSESRIIKHVLTHQNIHCTFHHIRFMDGFKYNAAQWGGLKLYSASEINELPKAILIDNYLGGKIN